MYSAAFLKIAWQWLTETAIVLSVMATVLSVTLIVMYNDVHVSIKVSLSETLNSLSLQYYGEVA